MHVCDRCKNGGVGTAVEISQLQLRIAAPGDLRYFMILDLCKQCRQEHDDMLAKWMKKEE